MDERPSLGTRIRNLVLGRALNPEDQSIFHRLSLIAFFAWVGLGADGLSSSCYGPEEAFVALGAHTSLALIVALASAITIFVIASSYSQIIELFPTGGGGYLVASKLLSPTAGMVSGCALLIDYVLTITISVASGADAVFSFLPAAWQPYKISLAFAGIIGLMLLNARGTKESVLPLVPIFMTFVVTHAFAILYALGTHVFEFPSVARAVAADLGASRSEMGTMGLLFLLLRAYSMGAGTYTGIEAVSNGMAILREPKAKTAKRTMRYMAFSLMFTVTGLILAYLLYEVKPFPGKTLNAVLFESITAGWGGWGEAFVLIALVSEAALLLIAAQAGFLDGPRVLANMAIDRWMPTRFTMLSDRFVSQNGVLIMGGAALGILMLTGGSVKFLVVLYAINVFITFVLSQLGMTRHWWQVRHEEPTWMRRIAINGFGLLLTSFILVSVTILKFHEGGWLTILMTGSLVAVVFAIRRHYEQNKQLLNRLDILVDAVSSGEPDALPGAAGGDPSKPDPGAKTAVLLVNGFNGLGLHTLFGVVRLFGDNYKNFVFVQVGVIDAGVFKGAAEIERLKAKVQEEVERYAEFMRRHGYYAEGVSAIGTDPVQEVAELAPDIVSRFPSSVFFGGQMVFPKDTWLTQLLHNNTIFAMQRRLYHQGTPVVVLPIRV